MAISLTLPIKLDETIGDIKVRSLAFSLEGNLEENGNVFLNSLLE